MADVAWVIKRNWGGYGSQCDPANDYPHFARDVHNQQGDVLTALVPGTVVVMDDSGSAGGGTGCQMFIQPSAYPPGASAASHGQWYCYHFLPGSAVVRKGDTVTVGQKIAMCGYYGHGGVFTHTHTGWFLKYINTPCLGGRPFGPDIGPFLQDIKTSNGANLGLLNPGGLNPPPGDGLLNPPLGGGGNLPLSTTPTPFKPMYEAAHLALVNVPGFQGITEALDIAERFTPFEMQTDTTDITILGVDTGVPNTAATVAKLSASAIQATFQFTVANFNPFCLRFFIAATGICILIGLLWNMLTHPAIAQLWQTSATLAQLGGTTNDTPGNL